LSEANHAASAYKHHNGPRRTGAPGGAGSAAGAMRGPSPWWEIEPMDKNFMEFWGNFLLTAAKGQQQLEDMTTWVNRGFKDFDEMTGLFRKSYGLDRLKDAPSDEASNAWTQAEESFKKSWGDYMALFGVVPRDQYLDLVRKYEELKERAASQEETIHHLRILLSEGKNPRYDHDAAARQFDEVIKKQGEQIQKLMDNFGQIFKKEPAAPEEGGEETP
jgi:uncharacterized coiled-coil protein SlyX